MWPGSDWRIGLGYALCAAYLVGAMTVAPIASGAGEVAGKRIDRSAFKRPDAVPVPHDNPGTPAQVALGAALFNDTRLSRDGSISCATCHDPARSFTDGVSRGAGIAGVTLRRNTPTLWNLAWGDSFFWDGRAATLEQQARGPVEHPHEMDLKLADAVSVLQKDPETVRAFQEAYGAEGLSEATVLKALAAFERTLVSPKTRFDRWVEGDETALSPEEIRGFQLFTGRAACSKCHGTWRFTDEAFHDIGLPEGADKGRGEIAGARMNNAFKTPTLRELVWTAPYMHDGSLATIEGSNDHYFGGVENRPTISKDVPLITPVSVEHRRQLTAFLRTLSSERPPEPYALGSRVSKPQAVPAVAASEVLQRDRQFVPAAVRIGRGKPLTILNADEVTHSVVIQDPRLSFAAHAQGPGASVVLQFPEAGTYFVTSEIHPRMMLRVEVFEEPGAPAP